MTTRKQKFSGLTLAVLSAALVVNSTLPVHADGEELDTTDSISLRPAAIPSATAQGNGLQETQPITMMLETRKKALTEAQSNLFQDKQKTQTNLNHLNTLTQQYMVLEKTYMDEEKAVKAKIAALTSRKTQLATMNSVLLQNQQYDTVKTTLTFPEGELDKISASLEKGNAHLSEIQSHLKAIKTDQLALAADVKRLKARQLSLASQDRKIQQDIRLLQADELRLQTVQKNLATPIQSLQGSQPATKTGSR